MCAIGYGNFGSVYSGNFKKLVEYVQCHGLFLSEKWRGNPITTTQQARGTGWEPGVGKT